MVFSRFKQNPDRARELKHWQKTGGVLIIGYEMFRNLSCEGKKFRPKMRKDFQETLVDPGTPFFNNKYFFAVVRLKGKLC